MPETFIVKIGDESHEVARDDVQIPNGFVFMSQDQLNATITDRVTRAEKKVDQRTTELLTDDSFFRKAAEKRGITLDDSLKPQSKIDPQKVQEIRQQLEAELVDPLRKQNEELVKQAESGRKSALVQRLTQTARDAGIKDTRLKTLFPGRPPEFIDAITSEWKFDNDRNHWYFTDERGNPVYAESPQGDNPYAGEKQYFDRLRKRDGDFLYFEDRRPNSSGPGSPENRPPPQGFVTREQMASGSLSAAQLDALADGKLQLRE